MFDFSLNLFSWTLINFVILLFLVNKLALPAFFKMVEENEKKKNQAMLDLEKNLKDSQKMMADYQEKMSSAQAEAMKILNEAKKEQDELRKRETEKMITEKQSILAGVRDEVAFERKKMIEEFK